MSVYEYKVVPAPARGEKARGLRTPEERFAHALESSMNDFAAEGWEYLRADTLPCEERTGLLTGRTVTVYRSVLVFRRALRGADDRPAKIASAEAPPKATPPSGMSAPETPVAWSGAVPEGPVTRPAPLQPLSAAERVGRARAAPKIAAQPAQGPARIPPADPATGPFPPLRVPGADSPRPPRPVRRDS